MKQKFNLLDEPWICVLDKEGEQKEVSLFDALVKAQDYICLDGEMETQNGAILRLLLSVLMTVYYRYDADGNYKPWTKDADKHFFVDRWCSLWKNGSFNAELLKNYLEHVKCQVKMYK